MHILGCYGKGRYSILYVKECVCVCVCVCVVCVCVCMCVCVCACVVEGVMHVTYHGPFGSLLEPGSISTVT